LDEIVSDVVLGVATSFLFFGSKEMSPTDGSIGHMTKMRLDLAMVDRGLVPSREQARALIMSGKVLVNAVVVDKPGFGVGVSDRTELKSPPLAFASRGGIKLEAALKCFSIDPQGAVCMDVGASTGGFTDCLLQARACRVYAVDVGYGQLSWKLRQDSRVVVIERTNIRHLERNRIPDVIDLATIDVSFISLKIVIPAVTVFMKPGGAIVALIKPQFEVGKGQVGKGGVVKDPRQHDEVIKTLSAFCRDRGLGCNGVIPSPLLGPKGNREFLIHLVLT